MKIGPSPNVLPFARALLLAGVGFIASTGSKAQPIAKCPNPAPPSPPVTISPEVPEDVCLPPGFAGNPIDFFDDYSWRAFIALVWPAKDGQRGQPDSAAKLGAPGRPLVFETYKAEWEIFQPEGKAPAPWNEHGGENPCKLSVGFDDLVLAAFSKFQNVGMAGSGFLVGPLVAQNRTFVRYLTGFNEVEFKKIFEESSI